jgi:hypothetical protein
MLRRRTAAMGWILAPCCALFGSTPRIHAALDDPNFENRNSRGLLRSAQGLLFYVTQRIIDSHGLPPAGLRGGRAH